MAVLLFGFLGFALAAAADEDVPISSLDEMADELVFLGYDKPDGTARTYLVPGRENQWQGVKTLLSRLGETDAQLKELTGLGLNIFSNDPTTREIVLHRTSGFSNSIFDFLFEDGRAPMTWRIGESYVPSEARLERNGTRVFGLVDAPAVDLGDPDIRPAAVLLSNGPLEQITTILYPRDAAPETVNDMIADLPVGSVETQAVSNENLLTLARPGRAVMLPIDPVAAGNADQLAQLADFEATLVRTVGTLEPVRIVRAAGDRPATLATQTGTGALAAVDTEQVISHPEQVGSSAAPTNDLNAQPSVPSTPPREEQTAEQMREPVADEEELPGEVWTVTSDIVSLLSPTLFPSGNPRPHSLLAEPDTWFVLYFGGALRQGKDWIAPATSKDELQDIADRIQRMGMQPASVTNFTEADYAAFEPGDSRVLFAPAQFLNDPRFAKVFATLGSGRSVNVLKALPKVRSENVSIRTSRGNVIGSVRSDQPLPVSPNSRDSYLLFEGPRISNVVNTLYVDERINWIGPRIDQLWREVRDVYHHIGQAQNLVPLSDFSEINGKTAGYRGAQWLVSGAVLDDPRFEQILPTFESIGIQRLWPSDRLMYVALEDVPLPEEPGGRTTSLAELDNDWVALAHQAPDGSPRTYHVAYLGAYRQQIEESLSRLGETPAQLRELSQPALEAIASNPHTSDVILVPADALADQRFTLLFDSDTAPGTWTMGLSGSYRRQPVRFEFLGDIVFGAGSDEIIDAADIAILADFALLSNGPLESVDSLYHTQRVAPVISGIAASLPATNISTALLRSTEVLSTPGTAFVFPVSDIMDRYIVRFDQNPGLDAYLVRTALEFKRVKIERGGSESVAAPSGTESAFVEERQVAIAAAEAERQRQLAEEENTRPKTIAEILDQIDQLQRERHLSMAAAFRLHDEQPRELLEGQWVPLNNCDDFRQEAPKHIVGWTAQYAAERTPGSGDVPFVPLACAIEEQGHIATDIAKVSIGYGLWLKIVLADGSEVAIEFDDAWHRSKTYIPPEQVLRVLDLSSGDQYFIGTSRGSQPTPRTSEERRERERQRYFENLQGHFAVVELLTLGQTSTGYPGLDEIRAVAPGLTSSN